MTTKNNIISLTILVALFIFGVLAMSNMPTNLALGESFTGTISQIDSATTTTVGPDEVITIFAKGTDCDARVISTLGGSAIMLGFGTVDGFTVSGSVGHWQAASTTQAYDSGLYGCGAVTAYAYASSTITVSEF